MPSLKSSAWRHGSCHLKSSPYCGGTAYAVYLVSLLTGSGHVASLKSSIPSRRVLDATAQHAAREAVPPKPSASQSIHARGGVRRSQQPRPILHLLSSCSASQSICARGGMSSSQQPCLIPYPPSPSSLSCLAVLNCSRRREQHGVKLGCCESQSTALTYYPSNHSVRLDGSSTAQVDGEDDDFE